MYIKSTDELKNLLYIGNKLARHGYNQTSIETLGPLLESQGYNVKYASSRKSKVWRMWEMFLQTVRLRNWTDYVLIDTYSTYNFWYAFIISQVCRILKIKYIPKLHGGDLPNRLRKSPRLCKMIFSNSYLNIAPSGYLLSAFRDAGFDKTFYIPNTIEIRNYQFKIRRKLRPRILWVRSFSSIYNPEMAIRALELVKKDYPDAEMCMVGPDKNGNLAKIKQLALSHGLKVKFTGRISKEEWTSISQNYDIFINTTHYDNTPVSVIEAMALGLPVVSTNVGGIPFLLKDRKTALLVDDNDAEHMAACILEILSSQNLKNVLVQNALNLVKGFDAEKVKWKWFEILK